MKTTYFIKFLLLIPIVLSSCSDDEKKNKNQLLIDELTVSVNQAYITEGFETEDNTGAPGTGYTLAIPSSGVTLVEGEDSDDFEGNGYIFFLTIKATASASLAEGTYTFNSESTIFPDISWGELDAMVEDDYASVGVISGGTAKISKSGSAYSITFDLTLDTDTGEVNLKGNYKGRLKEVVILF